MNSSDPKIVQDEEAVSPLWLARLSIIGILLLKIFKSDYRIFNIPILKESDLKAIHILPLTLFLCLVSFNVYRLIQEYLTRSKIHISKQQAKVFSIICGVFGLLFFDMIFQDLGPALLMVPSLYFAAKREIEYSK